MGKGLLLVIIVGGLIWGGFLQLNVQSVMEKENFQNKLSIKKIVISVRGEALLNVIITERQYTKDIRLEVYL